MSSIMDSSSKLNLTSFLSNRNNLENIFQTDLQLFLDKQTKGLIKIHSLNLLNFDFSKDYEEAISKVLIESIDTKLQILKNNATFLNSIISGDKLINSAKIRQIDSNVKSYEKQQEKIVQADIISDIITADAIGYKDIDDSFLFSSSNNLITFIMLNEYNEFKSNKNIGFRSASVKKS